MLDKLFECFQKEKEVTQNMYDIYNEKLPEDLILLWHQYGLGSIFDGYLKIINPDEYQELIQETFFRGSVSIPILVTAFGDVIVIDEDGYIYMIKYKNGSVSIIAKNFKRFIQNIEDEFFIGKYFQIKQYHEAIKKWGKPDYDECFGYVPLLGLGGSEKIENLQKVKIREHIEIISQLVGKIGF